MNAKQHMTVAAAIIDDSLSHEIRQLLANTNLNAIVQISKTSLMDGDFVAAIQDVTVSIWYNISGSPADAAANNSRCTPDEYYRITDAGPAGGYVQDLCDGRSVVDIGDGSGQYLDVFSGDVIDYI